MPFFVRKLWDAFLELGIGPAEVGVNRDELRALDVDLYEYVSHLHIAVAGGHRGSGVVRSAPR